MILEFRFTGFSEFIKGNLEKVREFKVEKVRVFQDDWNMVTYNSGTDETLMVALNWCKNEFLRYDLEPTEIYQLTRVRIE